MLVLLDIDPSHNDMSTRRGIWLKNPSDPKAGWHVLVWGFRRPHVGELVQVSRRDGTESAHLVFQPVRRLEWKGDMGWLCRMDVTKRADRDAEGGQSSVRRLKLAARDWMQRQTDGDVGAAVVNGSAMCVECAAGAMATWSPSPHVRPLKFWEVQPDTQCVECGHRLRKKRSSG